MGLGIPEIIGEHRAQMLRLAHQQSQEISRTIVSKITVKYDVQVNVLRIRLGTAAIEESEQVEPGIIIDSDEEGNVVGIELLDASELISGHKVAETLSTKE